MNRTVLRHAAVFLMCLFFCTCFTCESFAEIRLGAGNLTNGQVVYVDTYKGFVVIDLGEDEGVEKGLYFEVKQHDETVAVVKIEKVRRNFSAANIEVSYKNKTIQVGNKLSPTKGDISKLVKRQKKIVVEELEPVLVLAQKYIEEKEYFQAEDTLNTILDKDPENERALQLLGQVRQAILLEALEPLVVQAKMYMDEMKYVDAEVTIMQVLELDPHNEKAKKLLLELEDEKKEKMVGLEPKTIIIDIDASKESILRTAINVFEDFGCMITNSNPQIHILEANKFFKSSLLKTFFTEHTAFDRKKVYYSVIVVQAPEEAAAQNRLKISLRGVYDSEGKIENQEIKKKSSEYKETEKMAYTIKNLAEKL